MCKKQKDNFSPFYLIKLQFLDFKLQLVVLLFTVLLLYTVLLRYVTAMSHHSDIKTDKL